MQNTDNTTPLLCVRDLIKRRAQGADYALHIPRLDVFARDKLVITGPSGSGKSTALDLLGLVLKPDHATDFTLATTPKKPCHIMPLWNKGSYDTLGALRLQHMGYVLQTGGLFPFVTVLENMTLTAKARGLEDPTERAQILADRLGIRHLLPAMPKTLSVGERQRVAIGRALAGAPQLLLADEPTASLDTVHARTVMDLLLQAGDEAGMTLIMVTHDRSILPHEGMRNASVQVHVCEDEAKAILEEDHA